MRTIIVFASSALFLLLATSAMADTLDSPGTYSVTFAAWSSLLPPDVLPPGTPTIGPTVYDGTLRIHRAGGGYKATFKGDSLDGHKITVQGSFDAGWNGVRTENVLIGGGIVDAIVHIDHEHLEGGHLNATVLVDGFTRRVKLRIGSGGDIVDFQVR